MEYINKEITWNFTQWNNYCFTVSINSKGCQMSEGYWFVGKATKIYSPFRMKQTEYPTMNEQIFILEIDARILHIHFVTFVTLTYCLTKKNFYNEKRTGHDKQYLFCEQVLMLAPPWWRIKYKLCAYFCNDLGSQMTVENKNQW